MPYWLKTVLAAGTAALFTLPLGGPRTLRAQGTVEAAVRTAGTTANLFGTLDPDRPIDGIRLSLPASWRPDAVHLLRYGTASVPVRRLREGEGTYLFTTAQPIEGPHELVLRVRLPERTGTDDWELRPVVRAAAPDSASRARYRAVDRIVQTVRLRAPSPLDRENRALAMADATAPLLLRTETLPRLGRAASFTIEFWMRTDGLDEVVLSTWDGQEATAYPAEFVVDQSGRLRFYSGEPGRHQALRTSRPVADGHWHYVAAVYDARRPRLRLLVDGRAVDSLRARVPSPPGPMSVAVGGRARSDASPDGPSSVLYSGHVDELRLWGRARSAAALRRTKDRPLQPSSGPDAERSVVRLGFDAEERTLVRRWPDGARRAPVALSLRTALQDLRARSRGRSVTLRWKGAAADVQAFVVERSPDGRSFAEIATLDPPEARRSASEDVPFAYTDEEVPGQVVYYRIRQRRVGGTERTSGTIKVGLGGSQNQKAPVSLIGNFPNPFAKTTTIAYRVRRTQPVHITVWDLTGHQIADLTNATKTPGYHEVPFEASDLPSGTYFVRLETPAETQSHRMVLLK